MTEFQIVLQRLLDLQAELGRTVQDRNNALVEIDKLRMQQGSYIPSSADVVFMLQSMANNKKIEAIKMCRQMTGYGLKESKDLIEAASAPSARN